MSFEDYQNENIKKKRQIIIGGVSIICMLITIIFITLTSRHYAIYKSAPFLDHKFLARDICYEGFYSIVKRHGVSSLVEKKYLEALEKAHYAMIDFEMTKSDFKTIKMQNEQKCKIILKDKNTRGHGLRSFKVILSFNSGYIFDYKISSIAELLLTQGDL